MLCGSLILLVSCMARTRQLHLDIVFVEDNSKLNVRLTYTSPIMFSLKMTPNVIMHMKYTPNISKESSNKKLEPISQFM